MAESVSFWFFFFFRFIIYFIFIVEVDVGCPSAISCLWQSEDNFAEIPFTLRVLGIEFRSSGMVASPIAVSPGQPETFLTSTKKAIDFGERESRVTAERTVCVGSSLN